MNHSVRRQPKKTPATRPAARRVLKLDLDDLPSAHSNSTPHPKASESTSYYLYTTFRWKKIVASSSQDARQL